MRRLAIAVTIAGLASAVATTARADAARVVTGMGFKQVEGRTVVIEVLVRSGAAEDATAATERALRAVGARPLREAPLLNFALAAGGVHWPQFEQAPRKRQSVPMSYNPAGDRSGGSAAAALSAATATWSDARTSVFAITDAGRSDRCPSVFCTGTLDGTNDIGWLEMPVQTGILAVTGSFFFIDSLELIEADVALNSSVDDWSTDGTGIDVETVILHELGHMAGLDHVSHPEAVMFPSTAPGEVKRELTASEIEGISYLYPRAAHAHPSDPLPPAPPLRASVIAALGDEAVSGGRLAVEFALGEAGDAGHVAFTTELAGTSPGQAAFRAGPAGLEVLARAGAATPGGGAFGQTALGPIALTGAGDAAFAFLTGPEGDPFGLNGGLFRTPLGGGTAQLVAPGVTETPQHGPLLGASDADAADGAHVVFAGVVATDAGPPEEPPPPPPPPPPLPPGAPLDGPPGGPPGPPPGAGLAQGVFAVGGAGAATGIAAPGDLAPGGDVFAHAGQPTINAHGDVAFAAGVGACPVPSPAACGGGVYRSRASGELERIAGPDDLAPDGGAGRVRRATGPVINDSGEVAYVAELLDTGQVVPVEDQFPGVEAISQALYLDGGGVTREIVRRDDELPHGSRLATLGRGAAGGRPFWTLNDRGDVAFVATLTDAIFADGGGSNGVYAFRDGRLRLVARSGTPVLGIGTIRAIGTFVPGVPDEQPPLLLTGGVALDDHGGVVFPATLTDGRVLLLRNEL